MITDFKTTGKDSFLFDSLFATGLPFFITFASSNGIEQQTYSL